MQSKAYTEPSSFSSLFNRGGGGGDRVPNSSYFLCVIHFRCVIQIIYMPYRGGGGGGGGGSGTNCRTQAGVGGIYHILKNT